MREQTKCAHSPSRSAFIVALPLIKRGKSKPYYRVSGESVSVQNGTLCQTDGIVAARCVNPEFAGLRAANLDTFRTADNPGGNLNVTR
jgi:hypothetical protein